MEKYEASLAKATEKKSNGLAGAVAAVVDKNGTYNPSESDVGAC